ncbi:acyl carrier protein [Paenibacillus sp. MDMC362]|uniref:acyl carrier protein n=1 Tax=Paenibacillus sp. MDMC362 TaxID=2977365 RepID=UPI000DC38193|nr:acyl carrier protein [Paenibacillus sp. MDMC362]RAR40634.1 hypothetical protein DP091_27565 [Paenibacillus sp. MDMC362]
MDRNVFYSILKSELAQLGVNDTDLINEQDNLIEHGVDSLALTVLISKIEAITARELPIEQFELSDFYTLKTIYEKVVLPQLNAQI